MSKLDDIKPGKNGNYPVEISINGEWIFIGLYNRKGVEKICDYADEIQEANMNTLEAES